MNGPGTRACGGASAVALRGSAFGLAPQGDGTTTEFASIANDHARNKTPGLSAGRAVEAMFDKA
jgi:hypothetical protein